MTLAGFGDIPNVGDDLRRSARRAATRGCAVIEGLWLTASEKQRADLGPKLAWLEARRNGGGQSDWGAAAPVPHENGVTNEPEANLDQLTPREMEVLRRIAEGNSTKEIAEKLGIAFKTAACHRYRVMEKLGIHQTASLVRYAIRQGIVKL
jgi:DNA-binding CsgD family transcriptional regulator